MFFFDAGDEGLQLPLHVGRAAPTCRCSSSTAARLSATSRSFSFAESWLGSFAPRVRRAALSRDACQSLLTIPPVSSDQNGGSGADHAPVQIGIGRSEVFHAVVELDHLCWDVDQQKPKRGQEDDEEEAVGGAQAGHQAHCKLTETDNGYAERPVAKRVVRALAADLGAYPPGFLRARL